MHSRERRRPSHHGDAVSKPSDDPIVRAVIAQTGHVRYVFLVDQDPEAWMPLILARYAEFSDLSHAERMYIRRLRKPRGSLADLAALNKQFRENCQGCGAQAQPEVRP